MQVIGRTDHQQIEAAPGNQLFRCFICFAWRYTRLDQSRQACRIRIDIADNLERRIDLTEHPTEITKPETKPDNGDFHAGTFPVHAIYFLETANFWRFRQ